jgi:hypothetical protein
MLFGKTALPYSKLRDDGVIDCVVSCTKIQKMMITFHIALTSLPAQTTLRSTEQVTLQEVSRLVIGSVGFESQTGQRLSHSFPPKICLTAY